jgi:phosphoribosylformylglycinamidine cyclo-ligase
MGHRLEKFCEPEHADKVIAISDNFNIEAKTIGWTEQTKSENGKNQLEIRSENKTLEYE